MQVWRKQRSLVLREIRRRVDRVHRQGGTARMVPKAFTDSTEEHAVIVEFHAARDAEYAEVLSRLLEPRREPATERARGNVTFAEVEEPDAGLDRFHIWLARIAVREAVEQAAAELAAFEEAALLAEAPEPGQAPTGNRLRAVRQP
jgi:hypothetical protein